MSDLDYILVQNLQEGFSTVARLEVQKGPDKNETRILREEMKRAWESRY